MTPDFASAAVAALAPGETLIGATVLLDRLRASFPALAPDTLSAALLAAGWTKRRFRVGGVTCTGFVAPPAPRR